MERCFFRIEIKINGRCRNTGLKSRFFPSVLRFRKEASSRIGGCRSISGNEAINTLIPHGSSHGSRCSNFQPILPVNRLWNFQGRKTVGRTFRMLQFDPHLLLLDEPASALDESKSKKMEELLNDWQKQVSGRTWIWVSHDSRQAERVGDEVLELEQFPDAFGTRLHPDFQRILPGAERFPGSTRFLFADFFAVAFTVAPPAVGTFHGNCRVRMVVQLLLVGLVMDWIFSRQHPWLIL